MLDFFKAYILIHQAVRNIWAAHTNYTYKSDKILMSKKHLVN